MSIYKYGDKIAYDCDKCDAQNLGASTMQIKMIVCPDCYEKYMNLEKTNEGYIETLKRFLSVIEEECRSKHCVSLDDPTVNEDYHVELTFQVKELQELKAMIEESAMQQEGE